MSLQLNLTQASTCLLQVRLLDTPRCDHRDSQTNSTQIGNCNSWHTGPVLGSGTDSEGAELRRFLAKHILGSNEEAGLPLVVLFGASA